ncbi:polysaccharide pyruvyl transferase family protein [Hyphomicrobium sp.]|uniref:polysaccharide pyruvyl transferase family protein n=1 Tax=Hyphomicrobium sp. TaxID=82 RepID=UPI0025B84091|nr:polysaccharide pyruvyl transferase family protein [Hyphomicrobium sp.]MCC7253465.1 polysaccharide pyruvyl transferase family protein [Hyphomicrobium sp.]
MSVTKTAFLGTPGFIPEPDRFSNAELMKAAGANTGNLVFQLASTEIVDGQLEHIGVSGKGYGDITVFRGLNFFVFPAANHLRADGSWDLLTKFLRSLRVPLVVLGLGAQAAHGESPTQTVSEIRSNSSVMDFVDLLKTKTALVTVRGAFTEAVCHELGLRDVLRIGCPSQFINPDVALGQSIARQLAEAKSRESFPIAVTASAPNELHGWRRDVEARLFSWLATNGGLYIQQSCETELFNGPAGLLNGEATYELDRLREQLAPDMPLDIFVSTLARHFRMHFDARAWMEDLSSVSLAIGTRIHGNMAALAASRPGVLVIHDARVGELADEMNVPKVFADAFHDASTVQDILARTVFDPVAFDAARSRKAGLLATAFERIGLPPSRHLLNLALRQAA